MFSLNTLKRAKGTAIPLTGTKPRILTPESYDHPRQFLYKGSTPSTLRAEALRLLSRKIKGPLLEWYPPGACQG